MYTDYELYTMLMGLKQEMKMYLDSSVTAEDRDFRHLYAALYQLPTDAVEYIWMFYVTPTFEEGNILFSQHEHIIDLLEKEYYVNQEYDKILVPISRNDFDILYEAVNPAHRIELCRNYI